MLYSLYGYRCLKPGGYIEQLEFSILAKCDDGSSADDEALKRWGEYGFAVGEKLGKTFKVVDHMKEWIEDGGFENVVEQRYKWPVGSWSSDPKLKDVGKWNLVHWEEGIEGWCLAGMTRLLGVRTYYFQFSYGFPVRDLAEHIIVFL